MNTSRRRKPIKAGTLIKIALVIAVILSAGFFLVHYLRSRVEGQFAGNEENKVQRVQVTTGSIKTTVSGSGTLANEDSEDTFISGTVDVTEVYVKAGDNVAEGDMLASVNSASVVKAMKEVQDQIDDLDEKINDLEEEEIDDEITSGVDGRIKKIYAEEGMAVADVMKEHGALMLISVDGSMALEVETDTLKEGDSVTVTTEDGTEYEGEVDAVWAGTATILIDDASAEYGANAEVAKDDVRIGEGSLYIHEEVAVTGFTGTIDDLKVSVNQKVSAGKTLLSLDDVSSTVNYATLLEQRADLEDSLQDLIIIYKEGAVYAKQNGMVTAITETEDSTTTTTTASSGIRNQETSLTTVTEDSDEEDGTTISICPTDSMIIELSVDETDILSLSVGQEAEVTISSLGEDTYAGTITELDTVGSSSDGVTSFTATLTIDKEAGMLAGMSASAAITIEGRDNALLLPVDAVKKTSSTSYVYMSYDEETQTFGDMTEVTTGLSNTNYIEILSGLSEGDTIYYTETEDENASGFGGMPGGGMPGGDMPGGMSGGGSSGGSNMPGGMSGGGRGSGGNGGNGSGRPSRGQ